MSKRSAALIQAVLEQHYLEVRVTVVNDIDDLQSMVDRRPDLVFLGMKQLPLLGSGQMESTKLWLAGYLDSRGIIYTGSPAAAVALDFDKPLAKQAVRSAGLATADYCLVRSGQYNSETEIPLPFPLFIKPPAAGGGCGIGADSVVRDFAAFETKVAAITDRFKSPALVEQYLSGREFSVAIIDSLDSNQLQVMPIELTTEQNDIGDRIIGGKIKAADAETVSAVSDIQLKSRLQSFALDVFRTIGGRDYGRIDVRLDNDGVPHFLEANLVPSLIKGYGSFPKACVINAGLDYEAMILQIAELGLARTQSPSLPLESDADVIVAI